MKKKRNRCYLLLGSILMLVLACVCFFTFVKSNLNQAANKNEFESIYVKSSFDYIVPAPSNAQMHELEYQRTCYKNGFNLIITIGFIARYSQLIPCLIPIGVRFDNSSLLNFVNWY